MHVETPRLLIRALRPDDVEPLAALWSDADVARYMGGAREPSAVAGQIRAALDTPPRALDLWPVIARGTDAVVGHCGLLEKEVDGVRETELVYVFARAAWGHGYASEAAAALRDHAFGALGLPRLIALIDPENAPSARVARKTGLFRERLTTRPGGRVMEVWSMEGSRTINDGF